MEEGQVRSRSPSFPNIRSRGFYIYLFIIQVLECTYLPEEFSIFVSFSTCLNCVVFIFE